jgi:hypothetical protein
MVSIRVFLVVLASVVLVACSSGPSDSDVNAIVKDSLKQMDAQMAPMGISLSDTFDVDVRVVNKADKGNNQWLVDTEMALVPKKSLVDYRDEQQMSLAMMFGRFEKGRRLPSSRASTVFVKGDRGWIASR